LPKYNNKKTIVDGITFDSKKEAARYTELKRQEAAGEIKELTLQPVYRIEVDGVKICDYRGDFRYVRNGESVLEDVKGVLTPIYRLKRKLVYAKYGIKILET
jgi:hypothetical protein